MGVACQALGDVNGACQYLQRAISLNPRSVEAHVNLGNVLQQRGEVSQAVLCYRKALKISPDISEAWNNLGHVLMQQGEAGEAIKSYRQSVRCGPRNAEAHVSLGNAFQYLGRFSDAIEWYQKSIEITPKNSVAYNNMGVAFKALGRVREGVSCHEEALRLNPYNAEAWNNLGTLLKARGDVKEAIRCFNEALKTRPGYSEAHSNLIFAMHYDPGLEQDAILSESQSWWQRHASAYAGQFVHHTRRGHGRIRLGYVSPDFREHSVSYFFQPLIADHSRDEFEVFCYSDVKRPDHVTVHIQGWADHWSSIVGLSDEDAAQRIYDDRIDILVDLAGHTADNRLLVFARRPAPVQVTWLGYPNATGMPVMDYRLSDAIADPEVETPVCGTEQMVRLPNGFLCYAPPEGAGDIAPLPARRQGRVTFGSFNNLAKINKDVVRVWAEILLRTPGTSLLLKSKYLLDEDVRRGFLDRFSACGISADRLLFEGYTPSTQAHMSVYSRVDIGLDPFPYNGTTTTCEALWMGVPVVSLKGHRHSARVGASILTQVGLKELISDTEDAYVDTAVGLSADLERLIELRAGMRTRLRRSPLCDGALFAAGVEEAYQRMWTDWRRQEGR